MMTILRVALILLAIALGLWIGSKVPADVSTRRHQHGQNWGGKP